MGEHGMKLTMLGTGNALVTECYNTCFILDDNGQSFMVDGGGNAVLTQIKHAGYDWMDMRHIFVTHKHVDHLLGIVWMIRIICQLRIIFGTISAFTVKTALILNERTPVHCSEQIMRRTVICRSL